jgi:2-oxoisovalerate dehydrogenase E1 component
VLENAILVNVEKIVAAAKSVVAGVAPIPRRAPNPKVFASRTATAPQPAASPAVSTPAPTVSTPTPAPAAAPAPQPATTPGVPLLMPNMDLIITEATVVAWLKKVGDAVKKGDAVLEIETDKAVSQVESPVDGVIAEILVAEGTVVPLGQQLAIIRTA